MDELIDVVTNDGKPTGNIALKSEIHKQGLYHNTAHIWFYTKENQILLAQRSANKSICPLLWDVSVAGHVDSGETIEEAAIRETKEEINLDIELTQLNKVGVFPCFQTYNNGIIDNEFHHTFIVELKEDLTFLKPQENEVEALKLVSINEFFELLDNSKSNRHFVASNKTYYLKVLNAIQKHLE
jgi:isopentenyldiphosphate isomerase